MSTKSKTKEELRQKKNALDNKYNEYSTIDQHSMMVISKYFDIIEDYINIEKSNKQYGGIIEQFKYNPIPFRNDKEREIFKNIETYHYYREEEREEWIEKDSRIQQYVHWERIYQKLTEKNEKHTYKNVIETKKIEEDECGEGVRYELYENGGMIIEGNGNMNHKRPWSSKKDDVK